MNIYKKNWIINPVLYYFAKPYLLAFFADSTKSWKALKS